MLKNTFCHIPGIGRKTETRIWEKGISDWTAFSQKQIMLDFFPRRKVAQAIVEQSFLNLENKNPRFFQMLLPSHLHWRLFSEFREHIAYVDIETTGLDVDFSDITTISLYDGLNIKYYIHGQNLEAFQDDILNYKLIVTYNGKSFDVPFLERYFRMRLEHTHIDLRHVLNRLGFKGGLKSCECQLGINRGALNGVDGYFAVLLWAEYVNTGNEKALETLLAYNIEDVVNLEALLVIAYNKEIYNTPFFPQLEIALPQPPDIPFQPDLQIIDRIRYGLNQC